MALACVMREVDENPGVRHRGALARQESLSLRNAGVTQVAPACVMRERDSIPQLVFLCTGWIISQKNVSETSRPLIHKML